MRGWIQHHIGGENGVVGRVEKSLLLASKLVNLGFEFRSAAGAAPIPTLALAGLSSQSTERTKGKEEEKEKEKGSRFESYSTYCRKRRGKRGSNERCCFSLHHYILLDSHTRSIIHGAREVNGCDESVTYSIFLPINAYC